MALGAAISRSANPEVSLPLPPWIGSVAITTLGTKVPHAIMANEVEVLACLPSVDRTREAFRREGEN